MRKKIIFADSPEDGSVFYLINPNNIAYAETVKNEPCIIHFIGGQTLRVDDTKYKFTDYLTTWGLPNETIHRM